MFYAPSMAFISPSPSEMLVVAVVALLLFGGKLPEVARSWGRVFAEFRRNLTGIQNEINDAIYNEPERLEYRPESNDSYDSYDSYDDEQFPGTVVDAANQPEALATQDATEDDDSSRD